MSNAARSLLDLALAAKASDVAIVPAGRGAGRVTMKRHGALIEARNLTAADVVSRQLLVLAGLNPHTRNQSMPVGIGSCIHGGCRVRVTAMWTQSGCSVSLRLHALNALTNAIDELEDPSFESLRAALARPSGIIVVAGPPSSGKTTRLAALLRASNGRNVLVASECDEIAVPDGTLFYPLNGASCDDTVDILQRYESDVIVIDEAAESSKLRMALRLAPTHLVMVTVKAPNLAGAVHMLRLGVLEMHHRMPGTGTSAHNPQHQPFASLLDGRYYADVIGVLRTTAERARWYEFAPSRGGRCSYCAAFCTPGLACPGCGARDAPGDYDRLSVELLSAWPAADVLALCERLERR